MFSVGCFAFNESNLQSVELTNYVGNTQNIHPKVLYFHTGWKGHKFWMAYTPYPYGKTNMENPCIATSDDGIKWFTPDGLKNPLAPTPKNGYNSDTHLVYRRDVNRLECWYRGFDLADNHDYIMRTYSYNGVNWTKPELVCPWSGQMKLSPAVFCDNDRYVMYYALANGVYYVISGKNYDCSEWSDPVKINLNNNQIVPWHLDVVPHSDGWHEILMQTCGKKGNNDGSLCYFKYNQEEDLSTEIKFLLHPDKKSDSPIGQGIYRSSLVNVGKNKILYISSIARDQSRHMLMVSGDDIIEDMSDYTADVSDVLSESDDWFEIRGRQLNSISGEVLKVYTTAGQLVVSGHDVILPHGGLYIVLAGNKSSKIMID